MYLLGEEPVAHRQRAGRRRRHPVRGRACSAGASLGFTAVGDDVPAFTHADLEALRLTQRLSDLGFVDAGRRVRAGPHAGPQLRPAGGVADGPARQADRPRRDGRSTSSRDVMDEVVPAVESLQNYVWRRHTLAVAARLLLAADARRRRRTDEPAEDEDGDDHAASGFADIVNYTRQSRSLSQNGARPRSSTTSRPGRWRSSPSTTAASSRRSATRSCSWPTSPSQIARIGLELVEERLRDEDFPELRVGLAWGPALARLGDVLGPVVNVASRLTSTSRPGPGAGRPGAGRASSRTTSTSSCAGCGVRRCGATAASSPGRCAGRRRGPGDHRRRSMPGRPRHSCTSRARASSVVVDEVERGRRRAARRRGRSTSGHAGSVLVQ